MLGATARKQRRALLVVMAVAFKIVLGNAFLISVPRHQSNPVTPTERHSTTSSEEEWLNLLDKYVLLYSKVDYSDFSSNAEVTEDLKALRKAELTTLVEDLLVQSDYAPDNFASQEATKTARDASSLPPMNEASLMDLSKQLDQAILEGYRATFSQDELTAWAKNIEAIHAVFSRKLMDTSLMLKAGKSVQPAQSTPPVSAQPGPRGLKEMETRLIQLQTVISPYSVVTLRTAMASPHTKNTLAEQRQNPESAALTDNVAEETSDDRKHDKPAPPSPTYEQEFLEPMPIIDAEVVVESAVEAELEVPHYADESTSTQATEGESIEVVSGSEFSSSSETIISIQDDNNRDLNETKATSDTDEAVDIVSTILSAAALGAVAYTKIPLFAAGIALGPAIKQSIAYATNALDTRQAKSDDTTTAEPSE